MVDLTKYSLKKGDVLSNNTNSKELVGRAASVNWCMFLKKQTNFLKCCFVLKMP